MRIFYLTRYLQYIRKRKTNLTPNRIFCRIAHEVIGPAFYYERDVDLYLHLI